MKHALWQQDQEVKEKLINQESKAVTTHLHSHVTKPDRAAGPPADTWQAAGFFWWL